MNIGFQGMGKLGGTVALAVESKGHNVTGCDINPEVKKMFEDKRIRYKEEGAQELLKNSKIKIKHLPDVVKNSDIIFVPIQTPHDIRYEGISQLPPERVDFDYSWLIKGIKELNAEIVKQKKEKVVIIISTVLPGTIEREIKPLLSPLIKLCYNPYFIAMGTTLQDFLNPEFVLFGVDDKDATKKSKEFYRTIHDKPFFETSIKNAEAIKVAYNTFISTKIAMINTWMEICDKIGADVDELSKAFSFATDRLISMKYLWGGAEDGGGCHPRDNIALSFLSRKLNISYDWFENIIIAREKHVEWLAKEMCKYNLPKVILGESFKKESNITIGSPSLLLKNILEKFGHKLEIYDPYTQPDNWKTFKDRAKNSPAVYLISTQHSDFINLVDYIHKDSVILDIWRYIKKDKRVRYIGCSN